MFSKVLTTVVVACAVVISGCSNKVNNDTTKTSIEENVQATWYNPKALPIIFVNVSNYAMNEEIKIKYGETVEVKVISCFFDTRKKKLLNEKDYLTENYDHVMTIPRVFKFYFHETNEHFKRYNINIKKPNYQYLLCCDYYARQFDDSPMNTSYPVLKDLPLSEFNKNSKNSFCEDGVCFVLIATNNILQDGITIKLKEVSNDNRDYFIEPKIQDRLRKDMKLLNYKDKLPIQIYKWL